MITCSSHPPVKGQSQYQVPWADPAEMDVLLHYTYVDRQLTFWHYQQTIQTQKFFHDCAAGQKADLETNLGFLPSKLVLCLFWGKELTFTGLAIKSDVQPVCHRLYTKVSTHYCIFFFCIYVFMSTFSISIHVHTHLTLKNSECYKIKYSKMSKYHKWRFLCNHEFNKKTPHRLAEDGRWK